MNLFDLAMEGSEAEFTSGAISWLATKIGFDGLVWGSAVRQQGERFAIAKYHLEGREHQLIADYPASSRLDPVLKSFLDEPTRLQTVVTHDFYKADEQPEMRNYLDRYQIRHMQLVGCRALHDNNTYDWLVFFRADERWAFQSALAGMTTNMALLALQGARCQRAAAACARAMDSLRHAHLRHVPPAITLTARQQQVLHLLAHGWSNKMIARHLRISDNTLKSHLSVVFRVLGVHSRAQAAIAVAEGHNRLFRPADPGDPLRSRNAPGAWRP